MHCDSAYFYLDSNAFQAFSNVNVIKGDSIKLTGDTLYYRGIEKTADIFGNIRYQDKQIEESQVIEEIGACVEFLPEYSL